MKQQARSTGCLWSNALLFLFMWQAWQSGVMTVVFASRGRALLTHLTNTHLGDAVLAFNEWLLSLCRQSPAHFLKTPLSNDGTCYKGQWFVTHRKWDARESAFRVTWSDAVNKWGLKKPQTFYLPLYKRLMIDKYRFLKSLTKQHLNKNPTALLCRVITYVV